MRALLRTCVVSGALLAVIGGCGENTDGGAEPGSGGAAGAAGSAGGGAGTTAGSAGAVAGTGGAAGGQSGSGNAGSSNAGAGGGGGTSSGDAGEGNAAGAAGASDDGGEAGAAGAAGDGGSGTDGFVHPGCLSTTADLARMRDKVAANAEPWKASWDRLVANSHAQLTYSANPQATICAGGVCDAENYMTLAHDAAAAYQHALRYHVSGDAGYADKAIEILDAWAATLTGFTGDSNAGLRAALYGYQLACAGELLRGYGDWDPSALQRSLTDVFYPMHSDFLERHNGACEGNYWANWDLANLAAVLAIGVFADRRDIFDEGITYFKTGVGEGSIGNAVHFIHPDGSGQWQESGRDQGHNMLGPMLMGVVCEIAWNQGVDLYSFAGNRFLAGSEYVAAYNLGNEVPYVAYTYQSGPEGSCNVGVQPVISEAGRGNFRAGFELIYNHYVHRMGFAAPFTEDYAAEVRPEGGGGDYGGNSGGFDSLGFTTLTHSLEPIAQGAAPSQLRPFAEGRRITLSWTGSAYATGYVVKRSTTSGGPYVTIATTATERTSYVDADLIAGTSYYYVVSAIFPGGESANSTEAVGVPTERLDGAVIGTSGSFNSLGATRELVFDGSVENFFDAPDSVSWAGIDLGAGVSAVPNQVRYAPRKHFGDRLVGGKFQGSSSADFSSGVVDLFTVTEAPPDGELTIQALDGTQGFRYFRYLGPAGSYGNVAEVEFHGTPN
jgi:hypothetical protein